MNRNTVLIGFSLLCWGWLLNIQFVAVGLLLIIIVLKLRQTRFHMSPNEYRRWGDVSTLLVVFVLIYVYIIQPRELAIFYLLKCLPVVYAPVLFAQLLGTEQKIPLGTLFYSLRKQSRKTQKLIDFGQPFAALTLLSAGAADAQDSLYFFMASLFCIAVIWFARPVQSRLWIWLPVVALAVVLSFYGQLGLRQLSQIIEEKSLQWLTNWQTDPFKTQTSIGDIGELKLSDKIEFRLRANAPILLLQASYNHYYGQKWFASKSQFSPVNPVIQTGKEPLKQLTIFEDFNQDTLLALPDGTVKISGLNDAGLEYSESGVVKINRPPAFASYQVFYTGKRTDNPDSYDIQIPKQHIDWLNATITRLQLKGQQPETIAEKLITYFQLNFSYSLYLGTEKNADQALVNFMQKTKAGHCEYFAVATVLLLRQVGIPARLAMGYSVSEYNKQLDLYTVRHRHAHAWAIAYINRQWKPVDSTPTQWKEMEADNAGNWQFFTDTWSNGVFYFKQWQQQLTEQQRLELKITGALMLAIYLFMRLFLSKDKTILKVNNSSLTQVKLELQGLDSEFYLIEQQLQNTPQARQANESIQQWVERLQQPELITLYRLHYQYRFDPVGLSREQRQQLRQQVSNYSRIYSVFYPAHYKDFKKLKY